MMPIAWSAFSIHARSSADEGARVEDAAVSGNRNWRWLKTTDVSPELLLSQDEFDVALPCLIIDGRERCDLWENTV